MFGKTKLWRLLTILVVGICAIGAVVWVRGLPAWIYVVLPQPTYGPLPTNRPARATGMDLYNKIQYQDASGQTINDLSISYIDNPPSPYTIEPSESGKGLVMRKPKEPIKWVRLKHEKFELLLPEPSLIDQYEGEPLKLPVLIGDQAIPQYTADVQVMDAQGKPIAGAYLWVFDGPSGSGNLHVPLWFCTDQEGRFRLTWKPSHLIGPFSLRMAMLPNEHTGSLPAFMSVRTGNTIQATISKPPTKKVTVQDEFKKPVKQTSAGEPLKLTMRVAGGINLAVIDLPESGEVPLIPQQVYTVSDGSRAPPGFLALNNQDELRFSFLPQNKLMPSSQANDPHNITVHVTDRRSHAIPHTTFYYTDTAGKWVEVGKTDARGRITFRMDGFRMFTAGVGFDRHPRDDARLVTQVDFQNANNPNERNAILKYNAEDDILWSKIKHTPVFLFADAVGKPMPPDTAVTFTVNGQKQQVTLDDKSQLSGEKLADIYRHTLTVSHPQYGSALVKKPTVVKVAESGVVQVPLISDADAADDKLVFTGRVLDPDDKPQPGVRVVMRPLGDARGTARGNKMAAAFVLTAPDGTYRFRPIHEQVFTRMNKLYVDAVENKQDMVITLLPSDQSLLPRDEKTRAGPPHEARLARADRQFTLRFFDVDGMPVAASEYDIDQIDGSGNVIFSGPPNWMPADGKLSLASGNYRFYDSHRQNQVLLTIDNQTPADLALHPHDPFTFVGSVYDPTTGLPVVSAIILPTSKYDTHINAAEITDATWEQLQYAATGDSPMSLPEQIRKMALPAKVIVTDNQGRFRYTPGSESIGTPDLRFHVIKKGYAATMFANGVPRNQNQRRGDFVLGPVSLFPGAVVELDFASLPSDVPPAYGNTSMNLMIGCHWPQTIDDNWKRILQETAAAQSFFHSIPPRHIDLPKTIHLTKDLKLRLMLPRDIPVSICLNREHSGDPPTPGSLTGFVLPDGPILVRQGETRSVTMKRVEAFRASFKFASPEGKRLSFRNTMYSLVHNPNQMVFMSKFLGRDKQFTLDCLPGQPIVLGITHNMHSELLVMTRLAPLNEKPSEPIIVTLTPEEFDYVKDMVQTESR